jgi:hypothetical protein
MIRKIIRTAAHEAAHLLQIFPFTADRMKWFKQGGLRSGRNGQENLSTAVERDALLIEHAVAQAILPQPTGDTFHGVLWQQAPDLFKAAIGHPADVDFQGAFQAELHALFGSNMHDIRDEPRLRRLLARAAQALDRTPSVGGPNLTHRRRGDRALREIRATTPAIYFKDEPYGAIGLPDQVRSQIIEIQRAMAANGPASGPTTPKGVAPQAASSSGR